MKYKIYNEDVIEWAKSYTKTKFHALLCDPPYHLTSIVKRFGKKGSAKAQYGKDGAFQRASRGFMGNEWDGGDIAFNPETWALLGEHLYPGAFGMAFAASRNWHRMAVAIEDAGFVIHPTIFLWAYGSGFPKATNISKQLDKQAGVEKHKIPNPIAFKQTGQIDTSTHGDRKPNTYLEIPVTDLAKAWQSYRYGLQALKPAVEPIIVFQKPYEGKPLDNITKTGAGALNIDAARIPLAGENDEYVINTFDDGAKPFGNGAGHEYTSRKISSKEDKRLGGRGKWKTDKAAKNVYEGGYAGDEIESSPLGRWPANFVLDEEAAARLDKTNGTHKSGKFEDHHKINSEWGYAGGERSEEPMAATYGDEGGVSRFFYTVSNALDESDPVLYCAKASTKEKNAGLEERCPHPTVKPISLTKWLASLLLPPDMYENRTILVPFSGVGSELIGCGLAGWDRAVGIEKDTKNGYVDIANKRLEHWLKNV